MHAQALSVDLRKRVIAAVEDGTPCRHGRASSGERLRAPIPHGRWKTATSVGALSIVILDNLPAHKGTAVREAVIVSKKSAFGGRGALA